MTEPPEAVTVATEICALPMVRRLAALLDRDPMALCEGDPLPHGWHVALFNPPTRQSQLRTDGSADLGVRLPDLGLTRLMLGGRQMQFEGVIPIGAHLRRETRSGEVRIKEGRSGGFALINVEHRIFVEGSDCAAVVDRVGYLLRPGVGDASGSQAAPEGPAAPGQQPTVPHAPVAAGRAAPAIHESARPPEASAVEAPATLPAVPTDPAPDATRLWTPDERLLFRYSSITDNPHRIHYDLAYATQTEGYPALVVNGSLPAMFLLEMFRKEAGREPRSLSSRNLAPMFCGRPLHLKLRHESAGWRLWAEDTQGRITFEARAE